jgi:hypothetical protein
MFTKETDIKTCQKCHARQAVNEFILLGEERDHPSKPNMFCEREIRDFFTKLKARLLWRKYEAEEPYVSLSDRYPRLQD